MRTPTKRRLIMTAALILLLAAWYAVAQQPPPDGVDLAQPATWFLTAAGWGFVVRFAVAFLKANFLKDLHGNGTLLVGAALSILGAVIASTGILGFLSIHFDATVGQAISFGVTAFLTAAGSYDTQAQAQAKAQQLALANLNASGSKQ